MDGQPNVVGNVVKLVGEAVLPGASKIIDGNILSGVVHTAVSAIALATLGPVGGLVSLGVRLNSYNSSVNQRNLWDSVRDGAGRFTSAPAAGPAAPATSSGSSSRTKD
jgi:hypothetical protein